MAVFCAVGKQQAFAILILGRGGGDADNAEQNEGVGDDMTVAPIHLLADIVTAAVGPDGVCVVQ
jgi:hypothetical protein